MQNQKRKQCVLPLLDSSKQDFAGIVCRSFVLLFLSALSLSAAMVSSDAYAQCNNGPLNLTSSMAGPVAISSSSCADAPSSSIASSTASASYGKLSASGNDASTTSRATFSSEANFSDTIHLIGSNSNSSNQVQVNFNLELTVAEPPTTGSGLEEEGFGAYLSAGNSGFLIKPNQGCEAVPSCNPFTYTYTITDQTSANGSIPLLGNLGSFGQVSVGSSSSTATMDFTSIQIVDPTSGKPISGFSYTTDSGSEYPINADLTPEPQSLCLLLLGGLAIVASIALRKVYTSSR